MLAILVLHRAKLLASNQSVLALGVAPSGVRAAAPHSAPARTPGVYAQRLCTMQSQQSIHSPSPRGRGLGFRQGCRDRTHKGSMQGRIQVVEQSRCRTHQQQTTTIAQMQSQPSIHSLSPRGSGLGFRQGCRDRTPKGSMQGRIQVVEQSRCRTHRQQTTTIAETQSPQSVLIGIENLLYFYKKRLFLQAEPPTLQPAVHFIHI